MRRTIYILTAVIVAMLLGTGCEKEFDLKMDNDGNIIKVECFPGVTDSIYVRVVPCVGLKSTYDVSKFKPSVTLAVNGESVPVFWDGEYYVGDRKALPGDQVKVEVSAEGFESVESQTEIPTPVQGMKLEWDVYDITETKVVDVPYDGVNYNLRLRVKLTLDDPAGSVDAYGIQFVREQIYDYQQGGEHYVDTTYHYMAGVTGDMSDNPLLPQNSSVVSVDFDGYTMNTYNSLMMFMDRNFNGKTVTLEAENRYAEDLHLSGDVVVNPEGATVPYTTDITYRYKIRVYKMTSDFSRYAYAHHQMSENIFAEVGLAPAGYAYTNITNGAGALAGVLMYETEWFK